MAKFFKYAFGQAGILTPIPNDTQLDGSISYEQGFSTDYTLNPQFDPVTAKEVPLAQTNQYLNDITGAVQQYQTNGFPDFITTADNDGVPYPYAINSYVRYNNEIYYSLIDNNTDTPPSVNWKLITDIPVPGIVPKPSLVSSSLGQNLNTTLSLLEFNLINFDPESIWSGAPSYKFTPKIPGYYQIYGLIAGYKTISNGVSLSGYADLQVYKNGVYISGLGFTGFSVDVNDVERIVDIGTSGSVTTYMNGTTDFVQLYFRHSFPLYPFIVTSDNGFVYFGINYVSE